VPRLHVRLQVNGTCWEAGQPGRTNRALHLQSCNVVPRNTSNSLRLVHHRWHGVADGGAPESDAAPGGDPAAAHGDASGLADGTAASGGRKKGKKALKQTDPPSVTVKRLFPDGVYPEGEWQPYKQE
jgi:hypothetical protein